MKPGILKTFEKYTQAHIRKKRWHKVVTALACVVVFCTTYALILPAITMEHYQCGLEEHTHSAECYAESPTTEHKELTCTLEKLGIHQHSRDCYDADGNLICGYADFVIHTHDASCYDENGKLVCPLPEITEHKHSDACFTTPVVKGHHHTKKCYTRERGDLICTESTEGHTHSEDCYDDDGNLICDLEEAPPHKHTDDCYEWTDVLTCGLEESKDTKGEPILTCDKDEIVPHKHTAKCFDSGGNLICGKVQILEHQHTDACFETVTAEDERVPICGKQEHVHDENCLAQDGETSAEETPEETTEDTPAATANPAVVVEAFVTLSGEDAAEPAEQMATLFAVPRSDPGNISDYLTSAGISVNGQPYDGTSPLNPGEQFTVDLKWQLEREQLTDTLTYTYQLPSQINVKNVGETILYDEQGNRKGVYSITGGVLTVTYDSVADVNTTTFKLNATWNREGLGQETEIKWNDKLSTDVKFDNSSIAATKELLKQVNLDDGSLVGEYAVTVKATGETNNITLTDTLESEKFHFAEDYYDVNGTKYDYRYKNANGTYTYGNFTVATGANGEQTVTFPSFNLSQNGEITVEYGVKLDANDRFELDQNQSPTSLRNTATASYPFGEDTISSTVTVEDTYRAEEKWVVKERENSQVDNDVPYTIKVNAGKDYNMSGAVIGDHILTNGAVYDKNQPLSITGTDESGNTTKYTPIWVTVDNDVVSVLVGTQNAIEELFKPGNAAYKTALETAIGGGVTLSKENIHNYVFVNTSGDQFAWFTPQTTEPASYELSYHVDTSKVTGGTLANEASAGWKQWVVGDVTGGFIQEVDITKENSGVRHEGDDYFVDWTITLKVPAGRNALEDVFLYDALPSHYEVDAYDWLVGLDENTLDYTKATNTTYLNTLSHDAFTLTSDNAEVQAVLDEATTSLGHPIDGMTGADFKLYDADQTGLGQLEVINGSGDFANKRVTATRFGINLGTLPATTDSEGYTITVKYTTQVPPALIDQLNGRAYGTNTVALYQQAGEREVELARADSSYWVDHVQVNHPLQKDILDFDHDNRILTYRITIDPNADLLAIPNADYQLKDVLNVPGATYIENSFKLSFRGDVANNDGALTWNPDDPGKILWRGDFSKNGDDYGIPLGLAGDVRNIALLDLQNPENGSSDFTFTLKNTDDVWALAAPENVRGNLAPLELTYQVQLPKDADTGNGKITNSATFYVREEGKDPELLDGVKADFDYASALHKKLNTTPDADNGYVASFVIDVDKTVNKWPENLNTFTVQDDMGKSLTLQVDSVEVYGYNNGTETKLTDGYTVSYDDQAADKNTLLVTVTDPQYQRYQIRYNAKLDSSVPETDVEMTNSALIQGTGIKSEEIKKDIYIQEQDAGVIERNYEVNLLKFDASNTALRLEATFDLYAYDENGAWVKRAENLTTGGDGKLTINNTDTTGIDGKTVLAKDTWYKLVETKEGTPEGYIPSTTYFHIGQLKPGDSNPDGNKSYTTIPLDGGTHQVPNYKASLRLQKVDSQNQNSLTGAKFELYSDEACTKSVGKLTETITGNYSIDLQGLTEDTTYYLKETKAPDGYKLPGTVYQMTFDQEGKVTLTLNGDTVDSVDNAYRIPNDSSYELPQSGGPGTTLHTTGGLALIGAGLYLMYNQKKRRKGDGTSS